MIAVSVKGAEAIVDLLLSKGASVNDKSASAPETVSYPRRLTP